MSDTIIPITQKPIPCDFGPFAGGVCYRKLDVRLDIATSEIMIQDITGTTNEDSVYTVDLSLFVNSIAELDWSKTKITNLSIGTYTLVGSILKYTPNTSASVNRTVTFNYTVVDILDFEATAKVTLSIIDKTPTITTQNVTLSGTEGQVYTIDVKDKTILNNTTVTWATGAVISVAPSEGTATIANGIITFTPSQSPSSTRTITMKYKVTTTDGLTSESTISVALTDITPALIAKNFTITLLDTETKTIAMLSNLTIKNDTFKNVTFSVPQEGTITVTGSSVLYAPVESIKANRTFTVDYVATTTSGLSASGVMTVTITDDNIWAGSIWYGNSTLGTMTQAGITALSNTLRQQDFPGTYVFTAGSGVYKWLVYPKAWGEPLMIIDPITGFEVAMEDYMYLTVEDVELIALRSYYQLNGSFTIKLI